MIESRKVDDRRSGWTNIAGSTAGVALAACLWFVIAAPAACAADCSPAGQILFICQVTNVEDFAAAPETKWVIGSGLPTASNPQGSLYLFDTGKKTASAMQPSKNVMQPSKNATRPSRNAIRPDKKAYPDCPGPLDMRTFGPHGLDLTRSGGTHRTLYVVNRGGRESVEVFIVDFSKSRPVLTWKGCVIAPKGLRPEAVAALPDDGIVVTSLWDPADPDRVANLGSGQPAGALAEWHPGKGWSQVPGSDGMSGPSGVIVSPDGAVIYVGMWSGRLIARINRRTIPPTVDTVPTGILTGNLRWAASGTSIFVGGQDATVKQVLDCFESTAVNCNVPFKVYRMDPATLALTEVVRSGVYGVMGAGTGAIQVGNKIWVSSLRADRIGIFPEK
jgi:DNA-binding beta-propeller fold protein YncE